MCPAKPRPARLLLYSALISPFLFGVSAVHAQSATSTSKTNSQTDTEPYGKPSAAEEAATINWTGYGATVNAVTGAVAATTTGSNAVLAGGWDSTNVSSTGNAAVSVNSQSQSTSVFSKGGNEIAQGRSTTVVTINVNGKPVEVLKEVAVAVARITQYGAVSTAEATGTTTSYGNGVSSTPVTSNKPLPH
jgi:hypothetical protein